MRQRVKVAIWSVTGGALLLRWPALFSNNFHADEALFATWARLIAVWRDPLLRTQSVDKPPLLFYTQALFYPLLGPVEFAARLPGFIASILLVPLVAVLAWRLFGDGLTAVLAAIFVALSPFAIQFSATAFTDPLLTSLLVAALLAAASHRPGWSGMLFGLALLTKHQAWLFLPLVWGMGWMRVEKRPFWAWLQRWLWGMLPLLLLLVGWELARSGELALWTRQAHNFGGLRPVYSWELWPRLAAWGRNGRYLAGSTGLALLAAGGLLILVGHAWRRPNAALERLLLLYVAGYLLLHWLMAVPIWDRYLLPLVPLLGLLLARVLGILPLRSATVRVVVPLVLVLLMLPGAGAGRSGRFPVGGQPDADQGASLIAATLAKAPYGTVLYDHWYSWHWRYHLFDRRVFVSWFSHPVALAEELTVFGGDSHARYLVLPDDGRAVPIRRAVAAAGFRLEPISPAAENRMILYRILPQ